MSDCPQLAGTDRWCRVRARGRLVYPGVRVPPRAALLPTAAAANIAWRQNFV